MYNPKDNYCSYSPRRLFGVDWNKGCYFHDRQYRDEVKRPKTRKQADKDLRDYIYHEFIIDDMLKLGWLISRIYYFFNRTFGWIPWILWRIK